jgi:hypothetical protein|tara:strand:+ start:1698 stop:1964 length:267 start_codon:yes stop_codon:yes gene_type:complete
MTFYTKIDQSIHPKAKNYLNKIKSVKSNVINKKNSTIIKDIQNLYKKFNKPNEFGGTWEWIDKNTKNCILDCLYFRVVLVVIENIYTK